MGASHANKKAHKAHTRMWGQGAAARLETSVEVDGGLQAHVVQDELAQLGYGGEIAL